MEKITFGPQTIINPKPALLVGANVDDKPNFMTAAWCGIVNSEPAMMSVAIRPQRYTYKGVRQNGTLSVNVPSTQLMRETDYCGIISGAKTDKVKDCQFKVFYGQTSGAPLIEQCPINLECEVVHSIDMGSHVLVVGKVVEAHVSEDCLTDGQPDMNKVKPFIFVPSKYHAIGEAFADAFSVGNEIKKVRGD